MTLSFYAQVSDWVADLEQSRPTVISDLHLLRLPAHEPPWRPTGLTVKRGEHYSIFAGGKLRWSQRSEHLFGGPSFHLWARVFPGGRIVNLTADTGSFVADTDGEIEVGLYMGAWANEYGDLKTSVKLYERLRGAIDALVVTWCTQADVALRELLSVSDPGLVRTELQRLQGAPDTPDGWRYLVETGISEIYQDCGTAQRPSICLHAKDAQGIIRKPVDFPLLETTEISWQWKVDEHPSREREDTPHTHDYISIATEFNNGRDLTWIWSSNLTPGHHFHCPIKAWSTRETHYVVRCGAGEMGVWCDERRNVFADVNEAMGPPPSKITAVWLICVSTFHHRTARAEFAEITLIDGERRVPVL